MRQKLIAELYKILYNHKRLQGFQFLSNQIPKNYSSGIYFFFDKVSPIFNSQYKITYIGVTKNNNNNRLEKHQKGYSSFRDHVKEALFNRNSNFTKSEIDDYIHNLPYLFVTINNTTELCRIEKSLIELTSNYNKTPIHIANNNWLGYCHINDKITKSHLWNIQHVGNYSSKKDYSQELMLLEKYSKSMISQYIINEYQKYLFIII